MVSWLLVSILLPLVSPIILVMFYKLLPRSAGVRDKAKWMMTVKDGQLCWGAIAFCASGLYELTDYQGTAHGWVNAGLVILLLAASFIAAAGAVFSVSYPNIGNDSWPSHFRLFIGSGAVTLLSAIGFSLVHFHIV